MSRVGGQRDRRPRCHWVLCRVQFHVCESLLPIHSSHVRHQPFPRLSALPPDRRLGVGAETPLLFEVALCLNNKTKQPVDCPRDSLEATSGVAANACGEGYADGPLAFMPGTLVRCVAYCDWHVQSHRTLLPGLSSVPFPSAVMPTADLV